MEVGRVTVSLLNILKSYSSQHGYTANISQFCKNKLKKECALEGCIILAMVWTIPASTFYARFAYSQGSIVWEMHYSAVQMV